MRLDKGSNCRTYLGASANALVQATDILTDQMVAALSNADELLSEMTSLTVFNAAGQTPQSFMKNLNLVSDHVVQYAANIAELGPHPYLTGDTNESWRIQRAITELMRTIATEDIKRLQKEAEKVYDHNTVHIFDAGRSTETMPQTRLLSNYLIQKEKFLYPNLDVMEAGYIGALLWLVCQIYDLCEHLPYRNATFTEEECTAE